MSRTKEVSNEFKIVLSALRASGKIKQFAQEYSFGLNNLYKQYEKVDRNFEFRLIHTGYEFLNKIKKSI